VHPAAETALLALHVLAAACWFGPRLFWPRRLRAALETADAAKAVLASIGRELNVTGAAAVLVIATGLGLIFLHGGFGAVSPRIHAGLGLTLVAFVVGLALEVPAIAKIRAAVDRSALGEATPHVKRVVMGAMIEHTCWLATLVLMVWRVPPS
jgi:uncharacterized membrane protein